MILVRFMLVKVKVCIIHYTLSFLLLGTYLSINRYLVWGFNDQYVFLKFWKWNKCVAKMLRITFISQWFTSLHEKETLHNNDIQFVFFSYVVLYFIGSSREVTNWVAKKGQKGTLLFSARWIERKGLFVLL